MSVRNRRSWYVDFDLERSKRGSPCKLVVVEEDSYIEFEGNDGSMEYVLVPFAQGVMRGPDDLRHQQRVLVD